MTMAHGEKNNTWKLFHGLSEPAAPAAPRRCGARAAPREGHLSFISSSSITLVGDLAKRALKKNVFAADFSCILKRRWSS